MHDTRKQIIELIEPYMDKSLSEGCYWTLLWDMYIYFWKYIWDNIITKRLSDNKIIETYYWSLFKPIWHYDITAVLKFIWMFYEKSCIYWDKICFLNWFSGRIIIEIPNKPLHLYTSQEDKDVLDLLLNLS